MRQIARVLRLLPIAVVGVVPLVAAPPAAQAAPLPMVGLVQLDAGSSATCGVFAGGSVTCWGSGVDFGLGNGSSVNRSVPTAVPGISTAKKVVVGGSFGCALLTNGTVQCWGDNMFGQLGSGQFNHPTTPVAVTGLSGVTDLEAGIAHACAVLTGGTVKCWGNNQSGQLAMAPSMVGEATPVAIAGLTGVSQLALGGDHSCALKTDATMRCWGSNMLGQVGNGAPDATILTPTSPSGLSSVIDIAAGYGHNCVIVSPNPPTRTIKCWGSNDSGQTGGNLGTKVPAAISLQPLFPDHLDAYGQNTCVTAVSEVWCWGDNTFRQLGNNSAVDNSYNAVKVASVTDAATVAVGAGWVCEANNDQTTKCWGSGYAGRLGNGRETNLATPNTVPNLFPEYTPLTPARLLDSRSTGVTIDGQSQAIGLVAGNATVKVQIRNRGGVAGTATAVALNLTATQSSSGGWVTVWPCNEAKPNASNLNMITAGARANMVIGRITTTGADTGKICVSPSVSTHLIIDVMGYYRSGGAFGALTPARLFDSRPNGATIDNLWKAGGVLTPGTVYDMPVTGRGGVAAGSPAVALNVTATQAVANGTVSIWPCGIAQTNAITLSYQAGVNVADLGVTGLTGGHVCFAATTTTHLVIDVVGAFSAATVYLTPEPYRISDSRSGGTTFDNLSKAYGPVAAGSTTKLQVAQRYPKTTVVRTVVLYVTATNPAAGGYLTVYPCGQAKPNASNLNVPPGVAMTATVMSAVGDGNAVCIYNSMGTDLIVDFVGDYAY